MSERWDWLSVHCRASAHDGGSVVVEESDRQGRAEVTFTAPARWRLERLAIHHDYAFDWLHLKKAADGIVLVRRPNGCWEAHIVECKRKVKTSSWLDVQAQLHGSCIRLRAICGVLGVQVDRITLYTAFREDLLGSRSPDPALTTLPVEPTGPRSPAIIVKAWRASILDLEGFGPLAHQRIQLTDAGDDVGRATVVLGLAM